MALLDGTERWRWFAGPGELFAFLLLKGDNYRSYADMLRDAIPATIGMYTLSGALLGAVIATLVQLRRFLRVRRGLCPKCAYPMGESSVCTECGCELAKRARTA